MENQTLSSKAEELLSVFEALVIKHGIDVQVNPEHYTLRSPCAIDIEHDEEGDLVGIGLNDGSRALYFTQINNQLLDVLCRGSYIAHNGKSDFEQLRAWGVPLSESQLIWDTMLMGHIIDSSLKSYGLKDMAKRELGIEYPEYEDIVGKHKGKTKKAPKCPQNEVGCCDRVTLDKQPVRLVALYNAFDCYCTYQLYKEQRRKQTFPDSEEGESTEKEYFDRLEKPVSEVFANMETRGTCIDVPYLKELKTTLEAQIAPVKTQIFNELGPINLNSPKQLLEALHAKQIQPFNKKGKPSTDKFALEKFSTYPVVRDLLQYSELETLLSTFVYPYLERNTGVVHPFFNQCGTRTGRPSCSNPNLLQIPKRTENGKLVRQMFIPRPGMQMGDCDFGQIEPRVLAHLSKDPAMCKMFNDGIDFHDFTSERLFHSTISEFRDRAKVLNLSVGYRATFKSVQAQLGGTREEAQKHINDWWSLFPALRRWQENLIYDSKRSGYCTTLLGRRIKVDGLESNNSWVREAAERQLINNVTQGSAAEIMKLGLIKLSKDKRVHPQFGILVTVYDEILAESPTTEVDIEYMKEDMVTSISLDVPLVVDAHMGGNWADAH